MFPFLAPIRQPSFRCRLERTPERSVEIVFLADSPHSSRRTSEWAQSSATQLIAPTASPPRTSSTSPRPASRVSPRSGASRSAKSSPVPPLTAPPLSVATPPPPPTRHRNKGLETSAQMMELFGGGPSSRPLFDVLPPAPSAPAYGGSHGRRNVLEREQCESSRWEQMRNPLPTNAGPFFSEIEDHDRAYERALSRRRRKFEQGTEAEGRNGADQGGAQTSPAEEEMDKGEPQNVAEVDVPMNFEDECPAARILAELGLDSGYQEINDLSPIEEVDTPESSSDWKEAKEDVLGKEKRKTSQEEQEGDEEEDQLFQPGPDMGGDEEVIQLDDEGRVIEKRTERRVSEERGGESAESEEGAETHSGADAAAEERTDSGEGRAAAMAVLVRGAQVVNDDSVFTADVLIQDGLITQVGASVEAPAGAVVLEAMGRMLLPAGIDAHTCFSAAASVDDFKSGTTAAAAGGTATVIELVSPRDGEGLSAALSRAKQAAEGALCHVGFSLKVRRWEESTKDEMERAVADGVNSFALELEADDALYQAMECCKSLGAHARILPENRTIVGQLERRMLELGITGPEGFLQARPEQLEKERVSTVCLLSQLTNCPVSILSLSSAESASALCDQREKGTIAHAEVATAAVCSEGSHYFNKCWQHAAGHLTESPLRTEANTQQKLLNTLASAPLCVFASGHKAHSSASRAGKDFTQMPKGVAAAEERLCVLWERGVRAGRIDPMRFVALTSTNPAKVFNLYPRKGRIAVGADGDVVLWDPIVKRRLGAKEGSSNADCSVFEGMSVHGGASVTIVGGRISWKEGVAGEGRGQVLALPPNSPYLFSVVQIRDKSQSFEKVERSESVSASNGTPRPKYESPFDNTPVRPRKHNESSISFGGDERPTAPRGRNPPGGRTTGFW